VKAGMFCVTALCAVSIAVKLPHDRKYIGNISVLTLHAAGNIKNFDFQMHEIISGKHRDSKRLTPNVSPYEA